MGVLYVTQLELAENEGILKKVKAQAKAMSRIKSECILITKKGNGCCGFYFKKGNEVGSKKQHFSSSVIDTATNMLDQNIELVYIRLMIPSLKLISFLKQAKRRKTKIYYEIPTYPYWGEQFKVSKKKIRPIVKTMLDIVFAYTIYSRLDKLVIVKSSTKVKKLKKMVEINNGVDTDAIKKKDYNTRSNDNIIRFVGVGTIYPYHGYDRFFYALRNCNEEYKGRTIETHIVGNSDTINDLKELSIDLGLKHVIFDGIKTTEELNIMYDSFDAGLGCLALYRRNADIDTTLKIVEYYCRGIPVITSGLSAMPLINGKSSTIIVPNDNSKIDMDKVCGYLLSMDDEVLKNISSVATQIYDWNIIFSDLIG